MQGSTRRQFLGSSVALGALSSSLEAAEKSDRLGSEVARAAVEPFAQEYTIAARQTDKDHYMHDPGMALLPDGTIFVASPCMEWKHKRVLRNTRNKRTVVGRQLLLSRSHDRGKTWEELEPMPHGDATPFVHDGVLYMLLPGGGVSLVRSDDQGTTWSKPVKLFEGYHWNCSTPMVVKDGRLYWGIGEVSTISADLSQNLMDPQNWRMSNIVKLPEIPASLKRNLYPTRKELWPVQWASDLWLEPNVVNVNGQLRLLLRVVIDEYATANICAICDLDDDGGKMDLRFSQFAALPGAQNKFFILYDDESRLFWMLSNLPTDSQGFFFDREELLRIGFHGGPGNERRILMLHYSIDALNWFSAGCAAKWPSPIQSFMYPSAAIDGDDIVFISRTSKEAQNQHDADLVTFHRIRNFRSLAMDIFPKFPQQPNI